VNKMMTLDLSRRVYDQASKSSFDWSGLWTAELDGVYCTHRWH